MINIDIDALNNSELENLSVKILTQLYGPLTDVQLHLFDNRNNRNYCNLSVNKEAKTLDIIK